MFYSDSFFRLLIYFCSLQTQFRGITNVKSAVMSLALSLLETQYFCTTWDLTPITLIVSAEEIFLEIEEQVSKQDFMSQLPELELRTFSITEKRFSVCSLFLCLHLYLSISMFSAMWNWQAWHLFPYFLIGFCVEETKKYFSSKPWDRVLRLFLKSTFSHGIRISSTLMSSHFPVNLSDAYFFKKLTKAKYICVWPFRIVWV